MVLSQQKEVIQGLVCLEIMSNYLFMHLIETAPHNFGKNKKYFGVMGNLVAFCCKMSYEKGFDGEMGFDSKTELIEHYTRNVSILFLDLRKRK